MRTQPGFADRSLKNVSESSYGQMLEGKIAEADSVAIKYTEGLQALEHEAT
jgi:hypothetical protein